MNTQFWLVQAFNGVVLWRVVVSCRQRAVADLRRHAHRQPVAWLLFSAGRLHRAVGHSRDRLVGAVAAGRRARGRRSSALLMERLFLRSEGLRACPQRRDRVRHRRPRPHWPHRALRHFIGSGWTAVHRLVAAIIAFRGLLHSEPHFDRPDRNRRAAPGAAHRRLRLPVPAGRARHLGRQQHGHQSAGGARRKASSSAASICRSIACS